MPTNNCTRVQDMPQEVAAVQQLKQVICLAKGAQSKTAALGAVAPAVYENMKLDEMPEKGRLLRATRTLSRDEGKPVFTAKPYGIVGSGPNRAKWCVQCWKTGSQEQPYGCAICHSVWYCSPECQSAHAGDVHRVECAFLAQLHDDGDCKADMDEYTKDYLRLLVQLLAMYHVERTTSKATSECTFHCIWDLCSNYDKFPTTKLAQFALVASVCTVYWQEDDYTRLNNYIFYRYCSGLHTRSTIVTTTYSFRSVMQSW